MIAILLKQKHNGCKLRYTIIDSYLKNHNSLLLSYIIPCSKNRNKKLVALIFRLKNRLFC